MLIFADGRLLNSGIVVCMSFYLLNPFMPIVSPKMGHLL